MIVTELIVNLTLMNNIFTKHKMLLNIVNYGGISLGMYHRAYGWQNSPKNPIPLAIFGILCYIMHVYLHSLMSNLYNLQNITTASAI